MTLTESDKRYLKLAYETNGFMPANYEEFVRKGFSLLCDKYVSDDCIGADISTFNRLEAELTQAIKQHYMTTYYAQYQRAMADICNGL